MPLLLESLKAVDGRFGDLSPHIRRMTRSCRILFGTPPPDLESALNDLEDGPGPGIWKVRVLYDQRIRRVEAAPYQMKKYRRAALVDGAGMEYSHKTADRRELDLLLATALAAGGDTALIVKNRLITDFSYANAAFFDGKAWWTPAVPLLEGTRRETLIRAGLLKPADISPGDIDDFIRVSPINAMLELDEISLYPESIIRFPENEVR